MSFRLENLITKLLSAEEYKVVDGILDYLDIENSGNCFTDLVDIVNICKKKNDKLESLYWFKQRLVNKIYQERGEAGQTLIEKVMK